MRNNIMARTSRVALSLATLLLTCVLLPGGALAQELFGCDNTGQLFTIDVVTGDGTFVCNVPMHPDPGATEVEYDAITERMFVQSRDGIFRGQLVDILTCAALGDQVVTDDLAFNGLEFVDGDLYGTGIPYSCEPSALMRVDPETGAATWIGATERGPISGLAWDPVSEVMFGVTGCYAAYGFSELVTIDLATGRANSIGDTGVSLGSLEFGPDGVLYGGGNNRDGGNLYRIDTTDGSVTLVGPTGFPNVTGLTFMPQRTIDVTLDILEAKCPNILVPEEEGEEEEEEEVDDAMLVKLDDRGQIKAVILGSLDVDVWTIDPATVTLGGVLAKRWTIRDMLSVDCGDGVSDGTFDVDCRGCDCWYRGVDYSDVCTCTCRYRDGFDDLLLKFDRLDVLGGLGDIVPGEVYQLTLEGALTDGQPIRGVDCLMIMLEDDDMDDRDQSVAASVDAMPNPFNPT
ncbi:MAG: hypothetical protein JSW50_05640, partial [Candidatus Latescibacterota bacterium]